MITKQFEQGNYNSWQNSVTTLMPKINDLIRHDLLSNLDKVLVSMVGEYSDIIRDSINVNYIINDKSIDGMNCEIIYNIEDFKVANVPDEAVQTDCNAIKSVFEEKPYTVKEITIDTTSGKLTISFEFLYDNLNKENDKA